MTRQAKPQIIVCAMRIVCWPKKDCNQTFRIC